MKRLGPLETRVMAYAQMRGLSVVKSGDLAPALALSRKQEREVLSRLSRGGLIAQVRRGLYLFPPTLPLGGSWSPDEMLALAVLMADCGARYQISGPNAFNRYGFDDQIPARLYAYNDKLSGDRKVVAVAFTFIKVSPNRLGDLESVTRKDGTSVPYASRTRTLVDAVYDWARFDSLPRAYGWIRQEVAAGRVPVEELARVAAKYGNQGTIRRIGALLEREGASERVLGRLARALRESSSVIPWVPSRPKRGKTSRRWGIVWNEAA